MVSVFAILIFTGCNPASSPTPRPDPNPTPKPEPTISSFEANPGSVNYAGLPISGKTSVSWSVQNAKEVYLNDILVGSSGSLLTDTLLVAKKFTLRLVDSLGRNVKSQDLNISVIVDPTFAKMCGTTGLSWKTTRNTSVRISDGNLLELLQPSELDDVFIFYPNAKWKVSFGLQNPQTTAEEEFRFNAQTSEIAIQHYDIQPIRKVEFISPTIMTWTYTKNGSIYTRYFEKL